MRAPGNSISHQAVDACCRKHDGKQPEGTQRDGCGTRWEKRETQHLLESAGAIERHLGIKLGHRAANLADHLCGRQRRLHLKRGRGVVTLEDRPKNHGLLRFREALILAVFGDAHNLHQAAGVGRKALADGVLGVKRAFSQSKVDDGDRGRFGIVMPSKLAAGEQLDSQRSEKFRGNLIKDHADAVGRPQVRFIRRVQGRAGLVYAERDGVGVCRGLDAGQFLNGFQCLPLEGAATFFGISSEVQLECCGGNVLRFETEVQFKGLLETAQGEKGSGDKNKAERHLNDDQHVAKS